MNRPGYTLPPINFLKSVPFIASAGSVFATDERGNGVYVYGVLPNPLTTGFADQAFFYRYAIGRDGTPVADSWQQLATPTWIATETVGGSGTDMIVDATNGRVYLVTTDNAAPIFHRLRWWNPTTNAWTVLAGGGGTLEAALAPGAPITHASLAHPCPTINVAVASDDFLYLAIGNGAAAARYQISVDTWAAIGGGGARVGAPAAGSSLNFVASNPDAIYGLRGGGTAFVDRFTISTNAWAALTPVPATETFAVGAEAAVVKGYPGMLFVHRNGSIKGIDLGGTAGPSVFPLCSLEGADGAQHEGKGIVAYAVGTKLFVAVRKHSGVEFQRVELVL